MVTCFPLWPFPLLSLVFCSLSTICLGAAFFGIYLSFWIFSELPGCVLVSVINFGNLSAFIASNISSLPFTISLT